MNVIIAINNKGTLTPKTVRAKTSLGLGHGTFVDHLAVMYPIKKQLNIKVSLNKKIHIIALPQGTPLNAL
jgi:aromatic ring-opening dioxygenase catalytic subunit (LigB family)